MNDEAQNQKGPGESAPQGAPADNPQGAPPANGKPAAPKAGDAPGHAAGNEPGGAAVNGGNPALDAQILAAVTAALEAQSAKAARDAEEAARLAGLSDAEKFVERARLLDARERKLGAVNDFAAKGLPVALADMLDYASDEAAKASAAAMEKAFREAVQAEVNQKLKSPPPGTGKPAGGGFMAAFGA